MKDTRMTSTDTLARRAFLRRLGHLGIAGTAAPWAINLAAMAEAAAQSATDYKALVCVFLYGGNDHGNTVVPVDTSNYNAYATIRGALATPQANLAATPLAPTTPLVGTQLALAPELAPLLAAAGGALIWLAVRSRRPLGSR